MSSSTGPLHGCSMASFYLPASCGLKDKPVQMYSARLRPVRNRWWLRNMLCPIQLSHSKAMEIEDLLGRLSDVNDSLSSSLSGASDPRSHTLARHRDILHDYTQA